MIMSLEHHYVRVVLKNKSSLLYIRFLLMDVGPNCMVKVKVNVDLYSASS